MNEYIILKDLGHVEDRVLSYSCLRVITTRFSVWKGGEGTREHCVCVHVCMGAKKETSFSFHTLKQTNKQNPVNS